MPLQMVLYGGAAVKAVQEYVTLISKLKNHAMWHSDDGVSGVSQRMLRGAVEIQRRVGFLANQLTHDPIILRLSLGLCSDSVNFIQRLVGFIDGIYMEYKASAFFSETRLWELCVSYLEQVFEDLRAARCLIQDASENDTAILLWGILKSHEVMEEYLRHDFKKHPSINGILVQKILRSSPTTGLTSRIQALERSSGSVTGSLTTIKSRIAAVENKTSDMPDI
jgi:hypothetical protein